MIEANIISAVLCEVKDKMLTALIHGMVEGSTPLALYELLTVIVMKTEMTVNIKEIAKEVLSVYTRGTRRQ
jgi:hypothetical protein